MNKKIFNTKIEINNKVIDFDAPTYFIADIGANHNGDICKAFDLIELAKESGADAAKFQHFHADTIVSDFGFKNLGNNIAHQKKWNMSVYEVYKNASINLDWTLALKEKCENVDIDFFTSPYSFELVDFIDSYVSAHKIGSGDISWIDFIAYVAQKNKPVFLATGASNIDEVSDAVLTFSEYNLDLVLMQCNTNYTGSLDNFKYINLNVLNLYKKMFGPILLGLSDHTPGHATVLGAIALGAKVIEKHFTDNTDQNGPDHGFSMDPKTWKEMVERSRELELALGNAKKNVEENENETVVVQRRSLRYNKNLKKGTIIKKTDISVLRPCPNGSIAIKDIEKVVGRKLLIDVGEGESIKWTDSDLS